LRAGYRLAVAGMFQYYDKNADDLLDSAELADAEDHEYLRSVLKTTTCRMRDFIILQDADDDDRLSLDELNTAMGTLRQWLLFLYLVGAARAQ